MTTTDMPPTDTPPPPAPPRVLRRSRDARVAAGVSGGLGEYFGVDPVLFRVLFATSAFFGGAGILAYLLAWAAIPEAGTERAPVDGLIAELRRRRVPPWTVAVGIGVALWAIAFSWWAPGPFVPVIAVVVVLAVIFGRRDLQGSRTAAPPAPVNLTKHADGTPGTPPSWVGDARSWWDESRTASRRRRNRALPVKIGTLVGLGATLVVLAIVDAVTGIALPVYFWTVLGFVVAGVLLGVVLRRTPWSIVGLLPVTVAGLVAFGGSHASLHDGIGNRTWTPTTTPAAQYRLAFGQGVLDLRSLPTQARAHTVRVTAAAGQLRVLLPADGNIAVVANVHIGRIDIHDPTSGERLNGVGLADGITAPTGATGARTTVSIHLADGHVDIVRR